MKAGELVIDVIIKGADKTVSALKDTKNWLSDLSASGIAAKGAILGAFYAFERFTSSSGKWATDIKNLSSSLGLSSTRPLQQWDEYFRMKGGTPEDAHNMLSSAGKILGILNQGGSLPKGAAQIGQQIGVNFEDKEFLGNPLKVADALKKYLQTTHDSVSVANQRVSEFLSADTAGAIRRRVKGAPENVYGITKNIIDENAVTDLDQVRLQWSNFFKSLETFRNKATADFGLPILNSINKSLEIFDKLLGLIVDKMYTVLKGENGLLTPIPLTPSIKPKDQKPDSYLEGKAKKLLEKIIGPAPSLDPSAFVPSPKSTPQKEAAPQAQNINFYIDQDGIPNTHGSVSAFQKDILNAWQSIPSRGVVT